jgi:hypothetical protein
LLDPSDDHMRQMKWSLGFAGPVPTHLGPVAQEGRRSSRVRQLGKTSQTLSTQGAPSSVKEGAYAIEREGRKRSSCPPCQTLRPKIDPVPGR